MVLPPVQHEQALQIFEEMQKQDIPPNIIAVNALISAYEKGKQPKRASQILEEMQKQDIVVLYPASSPTTCG